MLSDILTLNSLNKEIAAKSNSEIEIVYRDYDIHFKEPTYFKPGLPIEIKVPEVFY